MDLYYKYYRRIKIIYYSFRRKFFDWNNVKFECLCIKNNFKKNLQIFMI